MPYFAIFHTSLAFILTLLGYWATGWTIGVLGFDSRRRLGIFLFTASRKALGPTQPPIQWVPGALSLGIKWPGREADHSPPSSAVVKAWVELYLHSPNTPSWPGSQLKHRDNFTFTSYLRTANTNLMLRSLWHYITSCPISDLLNSPRTPLLPRPFHNST
jgi:hypothetical protein